jgi:hypothetical protein
MDKKTVIYMEYYLAIRNNEIMSFAKNGWN